MYEAHFGLSGHPFGVTVSPSAYLALPSREGGAPARPLRAGARPGAGVAVRAAGVGQDLAGARLARDLGRSSAHLAFPALPASELVPLLAEEAGAGPGRIRRWRGRCAGSASSWRRPPRAARRPLLIVDEAHLIDDPATFEALRLLLNFATAGPPDLSLLLVGGPEVLLRLPAGLADRLTARCLLGPLTASESSAYVLGRLSAVGAPVPLFAPDALAVLHRAAGGLPRRLNRLADLALLIAYAEGLPRPDSRAVGVAAREFDSDSLAS